MRISDQEFAGFERSTRAVGESLRSEGWKDDHDEAMAFRRAEELLARNLQDLLAWRESTRTIAQAISTGKTCTIEQLYSLRMAAKLLLAFRGHCYRMLSAIEDAGYSTDLGPDVCAHLDELWWIFGPLSAVLDQWQFKICIPQLGTGFVELPELPKTPLVVNVDCDSFTLDLVEGGINASTTDPVAEALARLSQSQRGTPVKARWVAEFPIGPAPEPMEDSPPFLPLPGPGVRVQAKRVHTWPFNPPITWRSRE
ncbi:MAG: hypothetical protein JWN86_3404 [Planctomycetota bacterium]|nr:hypothetical protein [Planctomycetota bacterium]